MNATTETILIARLQNAYRQAIRKNDVQRAIMIARQLDKLGSSV